MNGGTKLMDSNTRRISITLFSGRRALSAKHSPGACKIDQQKRITAVSTEKDHGSVTGIMCRVRDVSQNPDAQPDANGHRKEGKEDLWGQRRK